MKALQPLLNARAIAVVGASDKPGSFGGQVVRNLVDYGFRGDVFGINPRLETLFGKPCFARLSDIPKPVDCVALAVANHHLLALLEEAAEIGAKAAVVFGDPTVGAGRAPELQDEIAQAAERHGLIVCGPNAMGVYALHHRLVISGYPVDTKLPVGKTALITASGTVFDALSQNNRNVAFNYVVSCGNEAVLSAADYLYHVINDAHTELVVLYLETVRNPAGFVEALELARHKNIPVVALKVGLTERGQAMTQAHTGALAGNAETYEALFRHYGVVQVHSLDEMMDTVELMSRIRGVAGNRVSALMESGGERSLVADLSQGLNLEFGEFAKATQDRLAEILDDGVEPANPLDAFGSGHDVEKVYTDCLLALADDPNTDLVLLAVDLVRDSYLSPMYVAAALAAQRKLTKPLAVLVNLTAGANTELMRSLRRAGIPVLMGTRSALRAIGHLNTHSEPRDQTDSAPPERTAVPGLSQLRSKLAQASEPLSEHDSKLLLATFGLPITIEQEISSARVAVEAAETIGYPVVLKTAEPGLLHKSDAGGIFLDLREAHAVRDAYSKLAAGIGERALVQQMHLGGTEMLLGMKFDPQFGPIVLIGLGGIFLEIYKDVVATLPTTNANEIRALLSRLQGYPLLLGARGRMPADLDGLVRCVQAFCQFVIDCGDLLVEVDINPLLVDAQGVTVLDALVIPR